MPLSTTPRPRRAAAWADRCAARVAKSTSMSKENAMSCIRHFLAHPSRACRSGRSRRVAFVVALLASLGFWPFQHARAAVAAQAIAVQVTGSGPDVLLVPGLATSGAVWDGTVAALAATHRCHVVTLAGFAGVPAAAGAGDADGATLARAEQALDDYIHAQRLRAPAIVGHSLGGFLALKLAIDHPDDVGRLVVVDALPALGAAQVDSLTPEQLRAFAGQMRHALEGQDPAAFASAQAAQIAGLVTAPADVARLQGWAAASDRATVVAAMSDLVGDDLRPRLARIHAPTLVLATWAGHPGAGAREQAQATFERQYAGLAGARIAMAPTARHFVMLDDPAWFQAEVAPFLR